MMCSLVIHTTSFFFLIAELPEVTIADVDIAVSGDDVTLNCSATGSTPLTYQWTREGSNTILNSNTSTGILFLTDIMASEIGTYVCNVSNIVGNGLSNITIELAGINLTLKSYVP